MSKAAPLRNLFHRLRLRLTDSLQAASSGLPTGDGSALASVAEALPLRDTGTDQATDTDPAIRADGSGATTTSEQADDGGTGYGWLPPAANPTPGVRAEDIGSQSEIVEHVGLTPGEFVVALVDHHDGRLEQQAFTEYTDLSESALSRLLGDLETRGLVQRFQLGCGKVVCLPEDAPECDTDHASQDAPRKPEPTPTA